MYRSCTFLSHMMLLISHFFVTRHLSAPQIGLLTSSCVFIENINYYASVRVEKKKVNFYKLLQYTV